MFLRLLALSLVDSIASASVGGGGGGSGRLLSPCSGSPPIVGFDGRHDDDPFVDPVHRDSRLDLAFRQIPSRVTKLKDRVRNLKNLYVSVRFRDGSLVEELEQSGFRIQGMPDVTPPTLETVANGDTMTLVHSAFESLARVALFLEQARIGETLAANERASFADHFGRLENDHEAGVYWVLCALSQLIHYGGQRLRVEALEPLLDLKIAEVERNSLRHARDYLVLRDFEKLLDAIRIEFAAVQSLKWTN